MVGDVFQPGLSGPNFQSARVPEPTSGALMVARFGLASTALGRRVRFAYG